MSLYECVFIVRQDIPVTQVETFTAAFAEILTNNGGKVLKTEQWGLRTLAYRINKNKKGHYVMFNLDASPAAVNELERNMRLHEDVLRYMTVRVEELEEGPSAVMRKEERTERGFGDSDRFGDRPRRDGPRDGARDGASRGPRRDETPTDGAVA